MIKVVSLNPVPLHRARGGRGYVWAINRLNVFGERRLENKRLRFSSWLTVSFIHIAEWYFHNLGLLALLNDEAVCCHYASSPGLFQGCAICTGAEESTEGEAAAKWVRDRSMRRERGRIWRDQRWACEVKYRSCRIINGYYESYADKWNILTAQFSQLGVMDGTVKQPESPTLMTDVSLNAHCAINPEIRRCGLMLMEEVKARVEV